MSSFFSDEAVPVSGVPPRVVDMSGLATWAPGGQVILGDPLQAQTNPDP